jgi:hypothetical protein
MPKQPQRFVSGMTVEADSLAEMVLTFYEGRLARMAVTYDRERTQGLTNADLHEGLYGASLLLSVPTLRSLSPPAERQTIGRWEDAKTFLLLWREDYQARVGLTITSTASDVALEEAVTEGLQLPATQGAATDGVRRTADVAGR